MKKYIITLLALFCSHIMIAQTDGCLIVKEYSTDEWHVMHGITYIDMNDDGEYDFRYYRDVSSSMMSVPVLMSEVGKGACFYTYDPVVYNSSIVNCFTDLSIPLNDSTLNYSSRRMYPEESWVGQFHLDTLRFKAAIQDGLEGEYYYGWLEAYAVVTYNYDSVWFYLARTGYCTIPNYPLRWGQTSLSTEVDENVSSAFATLHPNPTNGMVNIFGLNLKQAEVLNALGQRVATAKGEGDQVTVDISDLPTGVYFVNITDEDGRKCVRKVVKE